MLDAERRDLLTSRSCTIAVCALQLYRAPNVTGPYTYLLDIPSGGTPGIFEDGFLWQDPRSNWHIFFHTYTMTCDTPLCDPTSISGHRCVTSRSQIFPIYH